MKSFILITTTLLIAFQSFSQKTKVIFRDTAVNNASITRQVRLDGNPIQITVYKISGIVRGKISIYEKRVHLYLWDEMDISDIKGMRFWMIPDLVGSYVIKYTTSGTQASFVEIKELIGH